MAFHKYNKDYLASIITHRSGEVKLGTFIITNTIPKKYSILCIQEDMGVLANMGIGGTHTCIDPFLRAFLNVQSNQYLRGDDIEIWGVITAEENNNTELNAIETIDQDVSQAIHDIISQGKTPIVIGGGHNNAYGIIKGCATALGSHINTVNCDPHADLRMTDTRHSGNGFSYAIRDGYLDKYAILGLHQSYNNQYILDTISQDTLRYQVSWYEDIFIQNDISWEEAIRQSIDFVAPSPYGIELDMDAIIHTLSSAITPVGISSTDALRFVHIAAHHPNSIYLHLPEGVSVRADGATQPTIGKLLSYLVTTFIKSKKSIHT